MDGSVMLFKGAMIAYGEMDVLMMVLQSIHIHQVLFIPLRSRKNYERRFWKEG